MNVQDEIKSLKKRIAELEEQVEQEKEFPQDGDTYFFVDNYAEVMGSVWHGDDYDQGRSSIDNVFKTKGQAEFAVEKLKVEAELRKFSKPFELGSFNHYIFLDTGSDYLDVDSLSYCHSQGTIHFESEEKAQQAIEAVGEDRIKKYIFGVED